MKKIRAIFLSGIVVCSWSGTIAQSTAETALLFSRISNGGSARVMGMGGASVSLGGDFTSAVSNPAGLGMFNRSEFTITPMYSSNNNHTTYLGNKVNDGKTNLSIPSLGFVFQNPKDQDKWISSTFSITLTRMNDFNSVMTYEGRNLHNSIGDYFANDSYGIDPSTFAQSDMSLNRLAFDNYLIDPYQDSPTDPYYYGSAIGANIDPNYPDDLPNVTQRETKTISGAQNQWTGAYAVNIDDKFFFGAGVHLRSIRFESKSHYQESNYDFPNAPGGNYNPMNSVLLEETLKVTGSGYSLTLGAIMRPIDGFQIGLAFNTPTVYTMSDAYTGRIASDWKVDVDGDGLVDRFDYSTDKLLADYKLKTPGRVSLGTTYFFGKNGFISGDAEFLYFGNAKYKNNPDYETDNPQIKSLYRPSANIRLGGEYRLKIYRFRGGLGFQTDPFADVQNNISRTISTLSLGAGIRKEKYYVDVALVRYAGNNSYRPYSLPSNYSPLVKINNHVTNFVVTVGIPFFR